MMESCLNIVLPMAGRGQRFRDRGYVLPKPLIPVHGRPMVELVIRNLRPARPHRFVFLCLAEHLGEHGLQEMLTSWAPGSVIVPISSVTEGAACTVLAARKHIDSDAPLMIANCDQWIDADINAYLADLDPPGVDGLIMTMDDDDPKWSFVGFAANGRVDRVVEKQPISRSATVGIYNFRCGCDFVAAADAMIQSDLRVNGEFYVAPTYNQLIAQGADIRCRSIGAVGAGMYGLGTPADLDRFLASPVSHRAVA